MHQNIPTSLNASQAKDLLDLLIKDETFRQLFKNDAPSALRKVGYTGPTEGKSCFIVENLAPAHELIAARDALHNALSSNAPMSMSVVFFFEAGKIPEIIKPIQKNMAA